jgi:ribosomal protein S18 acetylase RimI-like enzyme
MKMPDHTAQQISDLFAANYPPSHPEEDREKHILEKLNSTAIRLSLENGSTYYVASTLYPDSQVAGFVQARTRDMTGGTYESLSWIMTDPEYRGQHLASLLHRMFTDDATARAALRYPTPTEALLNVHEQNPARAIYEKWGYEATEVKDSGIVVMTKLLPVEVEE